VAVFAEAVFDQGPVQPSCGCLRGDRDPCNMNDVQLSGRGPLSRTDRRPSALLRAARPLPVVVIAVLALLAVSCSTTPGGPGGPSGSAPGRVNAIPRDGGPCGPDAPIAPSGYFARADISGLAVRPESAGWISTLTTMNMPGTGGNLGIHWGNAALNEPTTMYEGYVYSYPVNFVNTTDPAKGWGLVDWAVGIPFLSPPPVFEPQPALIHPEEGLYPKLRSATGVQAWHLGSPDYWAGEDRMVFTRDSGTCSTYEFMGLHRDGNGTPPNGLSPFDLLVGDATRASGGVSWDRSFTPESFWRQTYWEPRGVGAAAIPITPMVLRFDEVARNAAADPADPAPLDHALYWASATGSCGAYVWPARHSDCGNGVSSIDPTNPSQGAWLRLAADFDDSAYSPQMKVIIRTLKTRGMVFADGTAPTNKNGIFAEPAGCQAVGGAAVAVNDPTRCWTSMGELSSMPIGLSEFEVVDPTPMRLDPTLVGGRPDQQDSADLWKCAPSFGCG